MKKIILSIVFFAVIILGSITAKAQSVTFYVDIKLTDTCSPGNYHGYYCVKLDLWYYGTYVCTAQNCNVTGSGCYPFTCSFVPVLAQPGYHVIVNIAGRYPSGTCTTNSGSSSSYTWEYMSSTDCYCKLSITL